MIILYIVVFYLIVILGIGYISYHRQRDMTDYYLGGRKVGAIAVGLAMAGANFSAFGFIGAPGTVYSSGFTVFIWPASCVLAYAICFWLIGRPMRIITERYGAMTIPDILELRYNSPTIRLISALAIFIGGLCWLTVQFMAFGTVGSVIGGVPYHVGLLIGAATLAVYMGFGGQLASIWTTAFQMVVMMLGVIVVNGLGISKAGGLTNYFSTLATISPDYVRGWHSSGDFGWIMWISWVILYGFGFMGQPQYITRIYTLRKSSLLKWAALIGAFTSAVVSLGYWLGGTTRIYTMAGLLPEITGSTDQVVPILLKSGIISPIISGVMLAGIYAAVMSTTDILLLVVSSSLVRDIYQQYYLKKKGMDLPMGKELAYSRWTTVVLAIIATALAFNPFEIITWISASAYGIYAAALTPAIVFGLRFKRITKEAAIASGSVGLIISLVCFLLKTFKLIPTWYIMDYGTWAILASVIVLIVVSASTKPTPNIIVDNHANFQTAVHKQDVTV